MHLLDVPQVGSQVGDHGLGEHGHTVLHAFSIAHRDVVLGKVDILDTQTNARREPEAAAVEKPGLELAGAGQMVDMSDRKSVRSSSEKITIGILLVLVGINAIWAVTVEHTGPLIAVLSYAFLTFFCWRRSHFQAGIIGGIFGLGIHICALILQGMGELDGVDLAFFCANLVLPIPLTYFSYRAHQEVIRGDAKS